MTLKSHPFEEINFTKPYGAYLIEASAGTGKTWTIEKLFVKALLSNQSKTNLLNRKFNIKNILLVTFTNASAQDLKSRISQEINNSLNILNQITQHKPLKEDSVYTRYLASVDITTAQNLLTLSLNNIDSINVHTLHSFCYQLIKTYPTFANISSKKITSNDSYSIKKLVLMFVRKNLINNSDLIDKELAWENLKNLFAAGKGKPQTIIDFISINLPAEIAFNKKISTTPPEHSFQQVLEILKTPNLKFKKFKNTEKSSLKQSIITHIIDFSKQMHITSNNISYDEIIDAIYQQSYNKVFTNYVFSQYPITFIDEFQDTDNKQFQIFANIYNLSVNQQRGYLILVGDPKQSIYGFRGADIKAYNLATGMVDQVLRLDTNYRSAQDIINFVNDIFSSTIQGDNLLGNQIFSYPLLANSTLDGNVHITKVKDVQGKNAAKDRIEEIVNQDIVKQILKDPDLLQNKSMAVLAHKNSQLEKLAKLLTKHGIKSYIVKSENIFHTNTAKKLLILLQAIILPFNNSNVNKAISHTFFKNWLYFGADQYTANIYKYRYLWHTSPILLNIIHTMLNDMEKMQEYVPITDLVNLLHLGEVLTEYLTKNGQYQMISYLQSKISLKDMELETEASIAQKIRIAQKNNAVILTTMHSAKGLEFDIVYCHLFPVIAKDKENSIESYQEVNRLIYVSFTRAKETLKVYCPDHESIGTSGKNNLLPLINNYLEKAPDCNFIKHDLIDNSSPSLKITDNNTTANIIYPDNVNDQQDIVQTTHSKISIKLQPSFHIQSYSSITHDSTPYWLQSLMNNEPNLAKSLQNKNNYQLSTPANVFGQAFHQLCEIFPYTNLQLQQIIKEHRISCNDVSYLQNLVESALTCNIHDNINLKQLYKNSICELKFKLKINQNVTSSDIQRIYIKHYGNDHPFIAGINQVKTITNGFLSGFIDLLYEYQGQYWIMDYKTNALNDYQNCSDLDMNGEFSLFNSIADNIYHLQYLIYLLALKKHLEFKLQLTSDEVINKIGGIVYFFVRGAIGIDSEARIPSSSGLFLVSMKNIKSLLLNFEKLIHLP